MVSDDEIQGSLAEARRSVGDARVQRMLDTLAAPTYERWLECLYHMLDRIIVDIEATADRVGVTSATPAELRRSEEDLTVRVRNQLDKGGFDARVEEHNRGHVDLTVRDRAEKNYRWLCEAKVHSDYDHLVEGMKQLLGRYASGRETAAGTLIYVGNKDCDGMLAKWRERLRLSKIEGLVSTVDDSTRRCFRSTHKHDSGSEVCVRHMGVHLHYEPRDKSAVRAASS